MGAIDIVALVVGVPVIVFGFLFLFSKIGIIFTTVVQGTIKFIDAGESLKKMLPNVGGFRISKIDDLDSRKWLIQTSDKDADDALFEKSPAWSRGIQKFLWEKLGIRFVSIFWPQVHVRVFDIRSRKRLKEGSDVEAGTPLKSRVINSSEDTHVNDLLFTVPRPLYVDGVQLGGDNSRINLLLLPVYRTVIPSIPVYYLQGDFFAPLDTAIEAAIVDFGATHRVAVYKEKTGDNEKGDFADSAYLPPQTAAAKEKFKREHGGKAYDDLYDPSPLTYAHWLKLAKAGENSPLGNRLRQINFSRSYYDQLKQAGKTELVEYIEKLSGGSPPPAITGNKTTKAIPSGIVPRFGLAMVSFRLVDWEPHPDTVELAKAFLAKETEGHTADGVRKKAEGARDKTKIEADGVGYAFKTRSEGEAKRYKRLVKALTDQKVDPNVAARVVSEQIRTENMRDSKLTTYIESSGQAGASVMIPPTQSTTS